MHKLIGGVVAVVRYFNFPVKVILNAVKAGSVYLGESVQVAPTSTRASVFM